MKSFVGFGCVVWVTLAACAGCTPTADYALVGSAYLPSAHGDIQIESIDKEQILINVTMDHLPLPQEVEPGMTEYVVWFTAVGGHPVPAGTLDYEPDARIGRASIPTSMLEFDLQITAEQSDSPTQPSDLVIATQKIREK